MFYNKKGDAHCICACNSMDHQMLLWHDDDDAYCVIHLASLPWYLRMWHALKYIFGFKSRFGVFEEFIFKPEHGDKLVEIGKFLKKKKNNENI